MIKTMTHCLMVVLLLAVTAKAQYIIPVPAKITKREGGFEINAGTRVRCSKLLSNEGKQLIEMLAPATGFRLTHSALKAEDSNVISLQLDDSLKALGKEGYSLEVTASQISIKAPKKTGIFYGMQTLRQLLPVEIASSSSVKDISWTVPCVTIEDKPRFAWRAFMLDESRHFKGEKEVKKLLDQMAKLKMNVFHWHLTDDQGWRIEIKKYPKLTEIGSKRADTQIGGWNSPKRSGVPHGGFYTQEQIRKLVAYASERHITIVPEIGMPGHASAAVAAYPELGTKREKISVPVTFGKHYHTYNPASEKTYEMLSDILDEIVALFPGEFIHIGGDEVRFDHWKQSDEVKELMKREGLKTMADVQIYFTNRMTQIIEEKGRRLMGWNEILGDDLHGFLKNQTRSAASLSEKAVVHFWKGNPELAERAIKGGHDVVNSWNAYSYLDYGYGGIPLRKAYDFDPVFKGLKPELHHRVMGMGCQMWGEWIPTVERMEYQVYPRLAAYAEVGWTPLGQKDYDRFKIALARQMKRWDLQGIGYAKLDLAASSDSDFYNVNTVDTWTPQAIKTDWADIEASTKNVVKGNGAYEAVLLYKKGRHGIDISQVALYENGKEIAVDKHIGFSGNKKRDILYKLKVTNFKPGATYKLKARVKGSAGTDSHGEIKLRKANSIRQLNTTENIYDPIVGKGRYIVTPKAAATPRINGPSIFGVRPGNPFLYAIPATGERPMEFSVENLPEGLSVNSENGHITGRISSTEKKTYNVKLQARNSKGNYEKAFRIVVGDKIALTPPLGWNSWNCWHQKVSQAKVLESARAMYDAGLQRVGWVYINMDDGWQAKRGGKHNAVMPNAKFPDMKGMVDEIHAMGFKAGIYHTPWVGSYAGYCGGSSHQEDGHDWPTDSVDGVGDKERYNYFHVGEHKFDKEDTLQWADWGIDYLKDDWDLGRDITPAAVARRKKALRECGRDIVYSLSNTGPLKFADTFVNDSNAWRISADIRGDWDTRGKGAGSILAIMNLMKAWAPYCGQGHYPDADMMMVDGVRGGKPAKLTGDEQYSHVSLWSLWSSPMLLGSAVDKMGDFGLSILSNPEVLEIHQDALCKMATVKNSDPLGQVWVKPLENGDTAVGLINLADDPRVITANWSEIGVQGKRLVRDVWRQRNIQVFEDSFSAKVPPHGTVLVRLSDPVDGVVAAGKGMKQLPAAPVITPPGGISKGATTVSLKTDSDATIYYTLDGSRPNKQSRVYTKPFTISVFTDVKAVAIKDGVESGVSTSQFFVAPKSIPAPDVDATTLEKVRSYAEWRDVEINKTGRYHAPFKHQGTVYKQGLGFYGAGSISYQLDPNYKRFVAMAVVDDSSAENAVGRFVVEIDDKLVSSSPLMKKGDSAWLFDVEIPEGSKTIQLICYRDGVGPQFVFDYLNCGFIKQSAVVNVEASVSFPGPSPEKANISLQPSRSILKNKVIEAVFEKTGTSARLASVHDLMAGRTYTFNSPLFVVTVDDNALLSSDDMVLEGEWKVEDLVPNPEAAILARRLAGKKLTAVLRHPDSGLKAIWSALLCDESSYIRQEVRFSSDRTLKLHSVALIVTSLDGAAVKGSVAGSPIVADNLFMGFEHPLSENAVSNTTSIQCSYARHMTLKGDDFYNCSAVIGVAPANQLRRAFLYYLERERAHPYRQYLHYNTWYDLNISRPKNRMTEEEVLASIHTIGTELVKKRGVQMEGFVMDDGWDSHESVWDFHEQFPNGFDGVGKVAASYQAGLGVWMSPWGGYGKEKNSRMQHGKLAGFEVNKKGFAMSGKNYGRHFKETCYRMMKDAGVNHFKFDGMGGGNFTDGARDELADDINAILDMTGELRGYNKEVWINATVGTWPSPFWTRYVDSIWRQGGDTGFAGVGSKREQWITYRDQFSYERIMQRGPLYPLNSLMFHGLVIGTRDNPGEMELNETSVRHEIRAAFGCGSGLQELYITPKLLTKQMWDDIAQSAKWARSNVDIMADTHWVGGNPGKLEVYGWGSWSPKKGVLTLRNPNEVAQTYKLDIAKAFELPENATKAYSLISPYQDQRLQKIDVEAGAVIEVRLEPFEVLVFDAYPENIEQKNAPDKK